MKENLLSYKYPNNFGISSFQHSKVINYEIRGLIFLQELNPCLNHSSKKWNDGLETRAELTVLITYIENQAILESTRLYRVSKCKKTKEQDSKNCYRYFYLFMRLLSVPFFSVKMQI